MSRHWYECEKRRRRLLPLPEVMLAEKERGAVELHAAGLRESGCGWGWAPAVEIAASVPSADKSLRFCTRVDTKLSRSPGKDGTGEPAVLRRAWASLKVPTEMRCDKNSCEMNESTHSSHPETYQAPPLQGSMKRHTFTVSQCGCRKTMCHW
jgi:hypothetical protein